MPEPAPLNIGFSATAVDRKTGMTFDELVNLVSKGMKLGVPGDSPIYGDMGWSQQIRTLHIRPEKRTQP